MARKDSTQKNDRRRFLTGVVAAGAATAMAPTAALAQEPAGAGQSAAPHVPSALPESTTNTSSKSVTEPRHFAIFCASSLVITMTETGMLLCRTDASLILA